MMQRNSLGQFASQCHQCGTDPQEPNGVCLACEEYNQRDAERAAQFEADEERADYLYDQWRDEQMSEAGR